MMAELHEEIFRDIVQEVSEFGAQRLKHWFGVSNLKKKREKRSDFGGCWESWSNRLWLDESVSNTFCQ